MGKYSPTVNFSYIIDRDWYVKNGGGLGNGINPNSDYDDDGFDSYGYNVDGIDRAEVEESCYYNDEELYYSIMRLNEWSCNIADNIKTPSTSV